MVQVLPANSRQSNSGAIGDALGNVLRGFLERRNQNEKQNRFSEALKGIEGVYSDPNLSDQQKFIKTFSALREFPEEAKQFMTGLSQFSETPLQKAQRLKIEQDLGEESFLNRLMGGNQIREEPEYEPFGKQELPSFLETAGEDFVQPKKARLPEGKSRQQKFDIQDPTTWTDKQIRSFQAYKGTSKKNQTLAAMANNEFERRQDVKKETGKYQEKIAPFQTALETLDRMQQIGARGNLGIGTGARGLISSSTRRDAAEYERLGKSLISLSSNIPIRNRQEFEVLAHDLYDPSISDASRSGILSAMRRIIEGAMKSHSAPREEVENQGFRSNENVPVRQNASQQRPPLTSFLR